jgi:hypothetical protein
MGVRFAGVALVKVDGRQIPLRGNLTVSPNVIERTMLAGQDGIHGFQELPRVPWIELDMSTLPEIEIEELEGQVGVTVVAQLANGRQYSLEDACCRGGIEINARDGQCRVRWEGENCREMSI